MTIDLPDVVLCSRCRCLVRTEGHGIYQCQERLDDRLEAISKASAAYRDHELDAALVHIRWLIATPQLGEPLVHLLSHGSTPCGLGLGRTLMPTALWDEGHRWADLDDERHVTCQLCKDALRARKEAKP
jgi:hypothetical protein